MSSFRQIIQEELSRRAWTGYRLGKESGVPIRSVQAYLAGQVDMSGGRLERLCDALGLELRPKRKPGERHG